MDFSRLSTDEAAVRRYVEELWLPYNRDLEATVDGFRLTDRDDAEIVAEEIEFRMERLEAEDYRLWIAVDRDGDDGSPSAEDVDLAAVDGEFAGFVSSDLDVSPPVFDRPDRVMINDVFVREGHRGTGLAEDLIDLVVDHAEDANCPQLALDVDVDNDRALGFYEKLGFEPYRYKMTVDVEVV